MSLINFKVALKLGWTKECVLAAADIANVNSNDNNITFTIKITKLYVLVVTLSTKDSQKLLSKGFEKSVY